MILRASIWLLSCLVLSVGSTQNLYIPANAVITINDGALVHASGDISNQGVIAGVSTGSLGTDQNLSNSGIIGLAVDSELSIGQDGINDGSLTSSGTLFLGGNWVNNNVSNLVEATVEFDGSGAQSFAENDMLVSGIVMNSTGPVSLDVPSIVVSETLDLQSGILRSEVERALVLESNAEATGGSETSYYDGILVTRGAGFKYYPVGNNGHFGPVEFEIEGIDPEVGVRHIWTNPDVPVPGDDLIGVSPFGLWSAELLDGSFNGTKVFMNFMDEDLVNFAVQNEITATFTSPVIAYADSSGGVFNSLGVESLEDTDSVSFGRILSDSLLLFSDTSNVRYFAIAKAPLIPPEGVWFVPDAFSPNASDVRNRTFRFFGERISNDRFLMRVYNSRRILLYETTDLETARTVGWDGRNQRNGRDQPTGVYFWQVMWTQEPLNEEPEERFKEGRVYLIR